MNDKFLYENRPALRKEFSSALYQRINAAYPQRPAHNIFQLRGWAWKMAAAGVLVCGLLLVTFSGAVRADLVDWVKSIAGFTVEERQTFSPAGASDGENPAPQAVLPAPTLAPGITPSDTPTLYPTIVVMYTPESITSLLANAPFSFDLPGYLPAGFSLDENSAVQANSGEWVMLNWTKPASDDSRTDTIEFLVENEPPSYTLKVGDQGAQEVQINGQPGLLIQGNWRNGGQWDPVAGVEIHWMLGNLHYRLIYNEYVNNQPMDMLADPDEMASELIKMAESVPQQ